MLYKWNIVIPLVVLLLLLASPLPLFGIFINCVCVSGNGHHYLRPACCAASHLIADCNVLHRSFPFIAASLLPHLPPSFFLPSLFFPPVVPSFCLVYSDIATSATCFLLSTLDFLQRSFFFFLFLGAACQRHIHNFRLKGKGTISFYFFFFQIRKREEKTTDFAVTGRKKKDILLRPTTNIGYVRLAQDVFNRPQSGCSSITILYGPFSSHINYLESSLEILLWFR